jgi:exonuclease SbcC
MIPLTLQLTDFLSYKRMEEPLDLSGIHVACLSGANGHGKSALLDAITWVLWGKARGSEGGQDQERLIRDGADTTRVEMTFELDGSVYRVARTRSRNGSVKADVQFNVRAADGTWTDLAGEGITDTQRRIVQRLRMDYETFVTSAYILQGRADTFTRLGPADRKEVLGRILGLEVYERLAALAKEKKKESAAAAEAHRADAERFEAECVEMPALEESMKEDERLAAEAEKRRAVSAAAQAEAHARLAELKAAEAEAGHFAKRREELQSAIDAAEREIVTLGAEVASLEAAATPDAAAKKLAAERPGLEEQERLLEEARTRDDQLAKEIASLGQRIAVERERLEGELRSLGQAAAVIEKDLAALPETASVLARTKETLEDLERAAADREALLGRRHQLVEERGRLQASGEQRNQARADYADRIAGLADAAAECPLCAQPLTDEHRKSISAELKGKLTELDRADKTDRARLKKLEGELAAVDKSGKALKARLDAKAEIERKAAVLDDAIHRAETAGSQRAGHRERMDEIRRLLETDASAPTERAKLASVLAERTANGYRSDAHKAVRDRLVNARAADRAVEEAARAAIRIEAVSGSRVAATKRLEESRAALEQVEADLESRRSFLSELPAAHAAARQSTASLEAAQQDQIRHRSAAARARERLGALEQKAAHAKQAREDHAHTRALAGRYATLAKAFGRDGIPSRIIGNAIPELRAEANRLLGMLTDGRLTVSIDPVRETKAKTLKDTLDITVFDAQGGKRAYEMYSGGERLRIDFALRIALSRLLAHRANTRLETLVIDEGFGTQDAEGRARLVESILKVRRDFRRVLVITHVEELKDQFPTRIEVSKDPSEGSRVRVL